MKRCRRLVSGLAGLVGLTFSVLAHGPLHEQITNVTAQLARHPEDVALLLHRGELNRLDERSHEARADFLHAQRLTPDSVAPQLGLGRLALDLNQPAEAVTALASFVAHETNHVEGHLLLARALVRSGHAEAAVAHFNRALTVSADPRPEWFIERSRAQIARPGANQAEALAGLDEGLAKLGPVPNLQLAAIELELQRAAFDNALHRLDTVIALSERQEHWLMQRGDILRQADRISQARSAYVAASKAVEMLPARQQRTLAMTGFRREVEARLASLPPAPEPAP